MYLLKLTIKSIQKPFHVKKTFHIKKKKKIFTLLKSPHVNKKSREHFIFKDYTTKEIIKLKNIYKLFNFIIFFKKTISQNKKVIFKITQI